MHVIVVAVVVKMVMTVVMIMIKVVMLMIVYTIVVVCKCTLETFVTDAISRTIGGACQCVIHVSALIFVGVRGGC